jgi:hypothetical protein
MWLNYGRGQRPEDLLGTEDGFKPAAFVSSRQKQREAQGDDGVGDAGRRPDWPQKAEDYMDEDDRAGLLGGELHFRSEFDTMGSEARSKARRRAEEEARDSAIPGPAPSELIVPGSDPIGRRLLHSMGWREGQGLGSRRRARAEIAEAAPESALKLFSKGAVTFAPEAGDEIAVPEPKKDVYGIGFDPFRHAPEFAEARRRKEEAGRAAEVGWSVYKVDDATKAESGSKDRPLIQRTTAGFAMEDEEDDVFTSGGREEYHTVLGLEAEEQDTGKSKAVDWASEDTQEDVEVLARRHARCPSDGRLPPPGFVVASKPSLLVQQWVAPQPPPDFRARHRFDEEEEREVVSMRKSIWEQGRGSQVVTSIAHRGAILGEKPPAPPPPPPPQQQALFDGLRSAMASRFTPSRSTLSAAGAETSEYLPSAPVRAPGLSMAPKKEAGSENPWVSPPPPPPPALPMKAASATSKPQRSSFDWRPAPLLCKRLNVPVPLVSKEGPQWSAQVRQSSAPSPNVAGDPLLALAGAILPRRADQPPQQQQNIGGERESALDGMEPLDVEVAQKPSFDLFKSIFDTESDGEKEEGPQEDRKEEAVKDDKEQAIATATSTTAAVSRQRGPELPEWATRARAHARAFPPSPASSASSPSSSGSEQSAEGSPSRDKGPSSSNRRSSSKHKKHKRSKEKHSKRKKKDKKKKRSKKERKDHRKA